MAAVILSIIIACLCQQVKGQTQGHAETYPMSFMNITPNSNAVGFIQIYGFAINLTVMNIKANNNSFDQFSQLSDQSLSSGSNTIYNYTRGFGNILVQADVNPSVRQQGSTSNFGILVAARDPIYLIGVKSDMGTTDAYMTLPLVSSSTEFFIAGWPYFLPWPFLTVINIVASADATCVEIYKIFNGNKYVLLNAGAGTINQYQVFRYFSDYSINLDLSTDDTMGEDVTGYYVNSTKPVEVYFGAECGWVPNDNTEFCDYMVEQIPPVSQLGMRHVVPPIAGRNPAAGYIVRVVAATAGTTQVTWTSQQITGSSTIMPGQWSQIDQPNAMTPLFVLCSQPCVVMQYNKGYFTVSGDESGDNPTDPFMQLVVPDDRFTAAAGFATANFCLSPNNIVVFDNFVTIVTFQNYANLIMLDGTPLANLNGFLSWSTLTEGGVTYAITEFRIDHGFHYFDLTAGSTGSFAVYVYGHSLYTSSSSAYGFAANYNITGNFVEQNWIAAAPQYQAYQQGQLNQSCQNAAQLTGAIVSSQYQYVPFAFTLYAGFTTPVTLSQTCLIQYNNTFYYQLLQNFTQQINYWICTTQNCSYLNGVGVAIDTSKLNILWISNGNNQYVGVEVTVTVIASYSATAQNFAQCRADIRNYMFSFFNWPPYYSQNLFPNINSCPSPLPFVKPEFVDATQQCPTPSNNIVNLD